MFLLPREDVAEQAARPVPSGHFIQVFHFLHGDMASGFYSWPFSMDEWTGTFLTLDERAIVGFWRFGLFLFLTSGQQGREQPRETGLLQVLLS